MNNHRAAPRAGMVRQVAATAILLTGALLTGCAQGTGGGPAGSYQRVYAADVAGAAKVCQVPKINPVPGQATEASMALLNDGGWCGIAVRQDGPKPFGAGLLTTRPAHGAVTIHEVGDDTRIDYTPDRNFVGSDSFAVKLVPGEATVRVAVSVATAP